MSTYNMFSWRNKKKYLPDTDGGMKKMYILLGGSDMKNRLVLVLFHEL